MLAEPTEEDQRSAVEQVHLRLDRREVLVLNFAGGPERRGQQAVGGVLGGDPSLAGGVEPPEVELPVSAELLVESPHGTGFVDQHQVLLVHGQAGLQVQVVRGGQVSRSARGGALAMYAGEPGAAVGKVLVGQAPLLAVGRQARVAGGLEGLRLAAAAEAENDAGSIGTVALGGGNPSPVGGGHGGPAEGLAGLAGGVSFASVVDMQPPAVFVPLRPSQQRLRGVAGGGRPVDRVTLRQRPGLVGALTFPQQHNPGGARGFGVHPALERASGAERVGLGVLHRRLGDAVLLVHVVTDQTGEEEAIGAAAEVGGEAVFEAEELREGVAFRASFMEHGHGMDSTLGGLVGPCDARTKTAGFIRTRPYSRDPHVTGVSVALPPDLATRRYGSPWAQSFWTSIALQLPGRAAS